VAEPSAETEYERFFAIAKRSLMAQAFLFTGDVEESRDLVQEVLFRAWREWSHVGAYDDPPGWARRVLHNLAIGCGRRERSMAAAAVGHVAAGTAPAGLTNRPANHRR
jgi:DNA-directed RNA polymerase specialized sigma24 family protein